MLRGFVHDCLGIHNNVTTHNDSVDSLFAAHPECMGRRSRRGFITRNDREGSWAFIPLSSCGLMDDRLSLYGRTR